MSYTKQTWATGDVVTAEKMNHMEDGIANAFTFIDPDYSLGERVVVVPTTTVEFTEDPDNSWFISGANPLSGMDGIDYDSVYTVTWDGVEYDTVLIDAAELKSDQSGGYYIVFLGNFAVIGNDSSYYTNAPFLIMKGYSEAEENTWRIVTQQTQSSHTVKIEGALLTKVQRENYLHEDIIHGRPVITFGSGIGSVLLGQASKSSARGSVAMGFGTKAIGTCAVAEGLCSIASGVESHAEGAGTKALGVYSHAEGAYTEAQAASHAEGQYTAATGAVSHAEGGNTVASGSRSHAEGAYTVASGKRSHAEGEHTIANHFAQHVFGQYNIADPSQAAATAAGNFIEIVGNGTADDARSNARTLDWSGNEELAGSITLGKGTADEVTLTAASLKSLLALLSN